MIKKQQPRVLSKMMRDELRDQYAIVRVTYREQRLKSLPKTAKTCTPLIQGVQYEGVIPTLLRKSNPKEEEKKDEKKTKDDDKKDAKEAELSKDEQDEDNKVVTIRDN